ncbi:hypothetical protein N0V83_003121 [Neocucurbitaria cava]|uniref:Uncharacterized protein n=1 Tax=Neocucurbitaria cava TaxID=798079 RepID=A0A9W8YFS1_9PLEO|nr:hypothetical protein N0V83_003121 [Neocucurbitaria cava]
MSVELAKPELLEEMSAELGAIDIVVALGSGELDVTDNESKFVVLDTTDDFVLEMTSKVLGKTEVLDAISTALDTSKVEIGVASAMLEAPTDEANEELDVASEGISLVDALLDEAKLDSLAED